MTRFQFLASILAAPFSFLSQKTADSAVTEGPHGFKLQLPIGWKVTEARYTTDHNGDRMEVNLVIESRVPAETSLKAGGPDHPARQFLKPRSAPEM